jgi:ATP-binding cassette subfamily B (MDR/TAP) protein 9
VSEPLSFARFKSTHHFILELILTSLHRSPTSFTQIYGQYIRKLSKATQERLAQANSIAEECLSTMTTVRSFACGPAEGRLYRGKLDEYYALNKQEARAYAAYAVATTLLPNLVTALVLFYGGQLVLNQDGLTSGQLVSFLLLLGSLSEGFSNMGSIFSSITQALGAADKVFELIRRPPKSTPLPEPPLAPPTCRGEVELRDVVFRYPARPAFPVLRKLNMIAKPGQVVALVGPSGGGKSSCVALLENFYEPESGMVLLDGRKVQEYDPHWFHRHVSIVSQEPVLYARSIRQNILFGLEGEPDEPTEEEIRQAAVLAGAHEFIMGLSEGYDTQVGERGVCLSGGQKQRIAIARALCRKPQVLLLVSNACGFCRGRHKVPGLTILIISLPPPPLYPQDEATSALVSTSVFCVWGGGDYG